MSANNFKKVLFTLLLVFVFQFANAQSAVYFDRNTGAIGYAYGVYDADDYAYSNCVKYGGPSPVRVLYVRGKGYGAIVIGVNTNGRRVIGAAAGYPNSETARQIAWMACRNAGAVDLAVFTTWRDAE